MHTRLTSIAPQTRRLVEHQIRRWEIARSQHHDIDAARERDVCDFIAISRLVGAGGTELAERLARHLNWPVFDRELLQAMAGDDEIRERMYTSMDERDAGWLEETLRWVRSGRDFRLNDYVHRLCRTVLTLARGMPAIFVGRAADLVLPDNVGLRVRMVAPLMQRVRIFAERHGLNEAEARDTVTRVDSEREAFVGKHFACNGCDSMRFDLVVNTGRISIEHATNLVLTALPARGIRV